jgi:hypothetical protein
VEGGGGEKERRISGRDLEVLGFVARFGVVPRSVVARWAGTARTMTLRREKRLQEAALLEVMRPWLSPEPVLVATGDGLAACGLPELPKARVSTKTLRHFAAAAHLAVDLEATGEQLLSERELLAHERAMGRRDFSLRLRGEEKYHRPDMVILPVGSASASDWERERTAATLAGASDAVASRIAPGGLGGGATAADSGRAARPREQASQSDSFAPRVSAEAFVAEQLATVLEVELTAKGRNRLDEILAGWKTAVARGRFSRVRYYCSAEALPYVERSVQRTGAGGQVDAELLPQDRLNATPSPGVVRV